MANTVCKMKRAQGGLIVSELVAVTKLRHETCHNTTTTKLKSCRGNETPWVVPNPINMQNTKDPVDRQVIRQ